MPYSHINNPIQLQPWEKMQRKLLIVINVKITPAGMISDFTWQSLAASQLAGVLGIEDTLEISLPSKSPALKNR